MAKPLKSANVSTNNILLKVTVPKRIGRKRRRDAEAPCRESTEEGLLGERTVPPIKDGQYLFRSMCDNSGSYQVEAIGTINQTHRFRGTRTVLAESASLCADMARHAGLCHFHCKHAAYAEVPPTYIAFQL